MEATKVFQSILGSIESSNLNYSLSKTPFSASISLKCSFINRYQYQEVPQVTNYDITKNLTAKSSDQDDTVKRLTAENVELRAEIETLRNEQESEQKPLLKEIVNLKDVYDKEKEVSREMEKNVTEFREEVLKIKKEKHNLSSSLKIKEEECENLKTKVKFYNTENVDLKKRIKDKTDIADKTNSELFSTRLELEGIKKDLTLIKSELENVKAEKAEKSDKFKCEFCSDDFETYSKLRMHIRKTHCQNKVTQFDENDIFMEYSCFYCDLTFSSRDDLEVHPKDCHIQLVQSAFLHDRTHEEFVCDICRRTFNDEIEVEIHMKDEHPESEVFWCDICPLYFGNDCELQFHIRGYHWNQM